MEFEGILKKASRNSRINEKRSGFSIGDQEKIMWIFHWS